VNDGLDCSDLAVPGKQRKARPDHRLASQRTILFGHIGPAGAQASAGGHDDCSN
jgi:hypothetical protein